IRIYVNVSASSSVGLADVAKAIRIVSAVASDILQLLSSAAPLVRYTAKVDDVGRGIETYKTSIIIPVSPRSSISLADVVSIVHIVSITVSDYLSISSTASPSVLYTFRLSDNGIGAEAYKLARLAGDVGAGKETFTISVRVSVSASSGINLVDSVSTTALHPISVYESLSVSSSALPSVSYAIRVVDSARGAEVFNIAARIIGTDMTIGSEMFSITARIQVDDSARGAEVHTLTVSATSSDSARGADRYSLTARVYVVDSGRGLDTYSITRRVPILASSNVGLSDTARVTAVHYISVSDSVSLSARASPSVRVTKTSSDSGKGSETYSVTKRESIASSSNVRLSDSTTITVARKLSASDSLSLSSSASVSVR
ncbi:MAG: hypothetical protein LM583_10165, partial [Desulfurococcaceae archaeon]|nr:hypothetical protein [Desulfurococcaceae archaeon]